MVESGHVEVIQCLQRMSEERVVKKMQMGVGGSRSRRRPQFKWGTRRGIGRDRNRRLWG